MKMALLLEDKDIEEQVDVAIKVLTFILKFKGERINIYLIIL